MGDLKKLNGRPPLTDGKRSKFINVRFTDEEFAAIVELETILGLSKTDLVRMKVLSGARQTVVNSRELITELNTIGVAMARIGNNINQLARHANVLQLKGNLDPLIVREFNGLFGDYIRIQVALETALRKIVRTLGG